MHATPQGNSPTPVLHDRLPMDKPDRLPLRQGWRPPAGERAKSVPPSFPASLSKASRYQVSADACMGEIHAVNERALKEARRAVQDAHCSPVTFDAPTVYRYVDRVRGLEMEPLMFVRVNARRSHLSWLVDDLRRRDARLQEIELQKQRVIARAEARLASILGLEQAILEFTDNTAQVSTWLVRYEPLGGWRNNASRDRVSPGQHGGD